MAFPTIPTAAANTLLFDVTGTASTTHTFPSLTTLDNASGDLLIAVIVDYDATNKADDEFSAVGAGFTIFMQETTGTSPAIATACAYKISDGTETGTFTITSAGSFRSAQCLMSIKNWHGTTPPECAASAATTVTAPDPPNLAPSWGSDDTLWIAVAGAGQTSLTGSWTGLGAAPANYTDYGESTISGGDVVGACQIAVAFRQLAAASEDPGAFTTDTSPEQERALTIAVRPAAAQDPPRYRTFVCPSVAAIRSAVW